MIQLKIDTDLKLVPVDILHTLSRGLDRYSYGFRSSAMGTQDFLFDRWDSEIFPVNAVVDGTERDVNRDMRAQTRNVGLNAMSLCEGLRKPVVAGTAKVQNQSCVTVNSWSVTPCLPSDPPCRPWSKLKVILGQSRTELQLKRPSPRWKNIPPPPGFTRPASFYVHVRTDSFQIQAHPHSLRPQLLQDEYLTRQRPSTR